MEKLPFADKESVQFAVVEIEDVRCGMNADFAEKLADSERFDEGRFCKERREFEKKWRDPDDVYLEVGRREEERKKQGLPPRLGVLPHSAVRSAESGGVEAQRCRKNQRSCRSETRLNCTGDRWRGFGELHKRRVANKSEPPRTETR